MFISAQNYNNTHLLKHMLNHLSVSSLGLNALYDYFILVQEEV